MAGASEPRVRILGLKVVERALDGNSEHGLVAVFDARVSPFVLYGAKLYRRRNGTLIVAMPQTHRAEGDAIRVEDESLRSEMCRAACEVARVLGANVDQGPPLSHGLSEVGLGLLGGTFADSVTKG